MLKLSVRLTAVLFSILHFIVDGICALIIFSSLYSSEYTQTLTVFLLYNFLAFLTQPLVGLWIDRFNNPKVLLLCSVALILMGCIFKTNYVLAAILLGVGNSFFHIAGGKYVIEKTGNNIVSLGMFVSTGAFGLALGQRYYSSVLTIVLICALILISLVISLSKQGQEHRIMDRRVNKAKGFILSIILLVLFVVAIRSFVGKIIVLDFPATNLFFLFLGFASMLGKFLGGILAKYVGIIKTIVVTMLGSIVCFCFFYQNQPMILLGTVLFNCSMPITLWYANEVLKKREGFSFGLLAFSLIPGYLLGMIEFDIWIKLIAIGLLCFASMAVIIFVDKRVKDATY